MYISKATAQEIVEEISREIGENINLMDETGRIIASVDEKRIDTIHEGAKEIIKKGLSELYITEEMETETTKKGINLPIIVDGAAVGVVGITGERERVYGYGNIVRHMTEILISDSILKDAKRYERRQRYHFLEEWIEYPGDSYSLEFQKRARLQKIDLEIPYRCMVIAFSNYQELSDHFSGQRLLEQMEASIRHEADRNRIYYLRYPSKQICILPYCSENHLVKIAEKIKKIISDKYQEEIIIGFDSEKKHGVRQSLKEAEKAFAQTSAENGWLIGYDRLGIEIFLDEISQSVMEEYLSKIFSNISKKEISDDIRLIETYFQENGSIQKIASKLFIHKNTVQYKLNKLFDITGYDLRVPKDMAVYYMALIFYKKLH